MEEKTILQVEHLSKAYKLYNAKSDRLKEAVSLRKKQYHHLHYVLKDISFDVKQGECIGVIGTNGSGKSTLLKIISGVASPTGGFFSVNGSISALLELGAGFNGEYTGLENIALNGMMIGRSKVETDRCTQEIVDFADIGDYIHQPVKNYSSGMFARLAFAVAISVHPDLLIVDEALSVGDVFFQSKCYRKIAQLQQEGTSILLVSHDMPTIQKMCDRVLWIEQGQQLAFGESEPICNRYFNEQTALLNRENRAEVERMGKSGKVAAESADTLKAPQLPAPSGDSMLSSEAEILSVYVQDSYGQFVKTIQADHSYTIGIVSRFHKAAGSVIIGFVMTNAKGESILAKNTYEDSKESFAVSENSVVSTTFRFTAPRLRNGSYEICPAIAKGMQEQHINLTWLRGVLSVEFQHEGYEFSEFGLDYQTQNSLIKNLELC